MRTNDPTPPEQRDGPVPDTSLRLENPARVIRISTMLHHLRKELDTLEVDSASEPRLRAVWRDAIGSLSRNLGEGLRAELQALVRPFDRQGWSTSHARLAYAELVGWLDGLFTGAHLSAVHAMESRALASPGSGVLEPAGGSRRHGRGEGFGQYL